MKTAIAVLLLLVASLCAGQQPRAATLTQQRMCADQAKKVFNEDYGAVGSGLALGMSYTFTSHYAAEAHICYVWVHGYGSFKKISDAVNVVDEIFDAFEGRSYASFQDIHDIRGVGKFPHAPVDCEVNRPNHSTEWCHSSEEFGALVDKYFGIGR